MDENIYFRGIDSFYTVGFTKQISQAQSFVWPNTADKLIEYMLKEYPGDIDGELHIIKVGDYYYIIEK